MTEHEWLTSTDPRAMLKWLTTSSSANYDASDRKLRLFAVACRIERGDMIGDVDVMEKADWSSATTLHMAESWARSAIRGLGGQDKVSKPFRAAILRDIFGNPFRPVSAEEVYEMDDGWGARDSRPALWITPAILSIAQAIYDERAFDRMPVLADALEEAGCRDEAVLRHCRGEEPCWCCRASFPPGSADLCSVCCPGQETLGLATGWAPLRGPHVRGCFVLDLILGKE